MEILYLLIPLGILILGIAVGAFIWAVKSGQFEDMQGPAHRILMDDDDPLIPKNLRQNKSIEELKRSEQEQEQEPKSEGLDK